MSRLACSAVLLALVSFSGSISVACSSTGSDKGAATGKTVDQAALEIGQCITHLDATLAALKDLAEKPAPDLKSQFDAYTGNLGKLESSAKGVAALAAQIEAKSQEYFAQWDQQIAAVKNEDIKEQTAERREATSAGFSKIQKEYSEVRDEFKPLLSDMGDIRTVLTADLTMDGLKTIHGTMEDVLSESKDVKESLQDLEKRFKDLGVKMSRSGPPAEAPKK